jgi:hypothetical protein
LKNLNLPPQGIFARMIQSQTVSAKFIACRFFTMQLTIRKYAKGATPIQDAPQNFPAKAI